MIEAALWIITNSELYKDEGVSFNQSWIANFQQELMQQQNENVPTSLTTCTTTVVDNTEMSEVTNDYEDNTDDNNNGECSEDEVEPPSGVSDTMLTPTDFLDDNSRNRILNVAPAEGNKPLSIFQDKYSEEMAYPGIFLGQKRPDNEQRKVNVHYSDICKSELRRSDRRAAMCIENIFFKCKKLQMKILLSKAQVALRKCKGNKRTLNAGNLKQQGALDRLLRYDEGFKFLRALRGSPPYFEKAKKDLFAMIRQLGPASLFCSFSSAETQWTHLLKILGNLVDNNNYTNEEINDFNWEERCRLIQSDPVTCSRHFDYQVSQFLRKFLMSGAQPLGKISDWFYRVEYQQRGSPHIHMLIWLENAPQFQCDNDADVTAFIDKIITCEKPLNNPELSDLVNRQVHRHSHTCRKNRQTDCRFNYPQPPMRATMILQPLDEDMNTNKVKELKHAWKSIKKYLDDAKEGFDITFDELLQELNVTEEKYLLAVQSSIKTATTFLKRSPNELRVNNYNPACLLAWRANMDIQFVLDVYACAVYIVNYISKGQKGMSELLREACNEARNGNSTIKQQVRDIGSKFINNVEISAQEAVYIVLQLPMRKASREIVFVHTAPPEERVQLLKPLDEIQHLEDECEEIYEGGLIKRYTKRPKQLEGITLADFAAWYDLSSPYVKQTNVLDTDDLLIETSCINDDKHDDDEDSNLDTKLAKKRTKARVIRSCWFNKDAESEKYYRELIMLFTSWRNEETDLIGSCSSYQERYNQLYNEIKTKMQEYAVCDQDFNELQQQIHAETDVFDTIAPCTESTEKQDGAEGNTDLQPDLNENYNLSDDLGIPSTDMSTEPLILNELPDDEYRQMVQMLNVEQKEFFYHVLHHIKTSDEPIYSFLSGGGGVGKSHLTKALYQAALKYFNSQAGVDFSKINLLLLAPTGKAAFNIKGNTIHSVLAIPASQSLRNYKPLDSSRLNTLRCQLGSVKLIFLDEISMVGNAMFNTQINNRLKDLKGCSLPFDGVSIIAIGDLFQLPPVMDGYVFKDYDDFEYGILAPNTWKELFRMFELTEIMRQRESKEFAELLNRLREGKHTKEDILKLKETGKAAFNIKGNTIHSVLAIPASQSLRNYKPLDSSRLNTLRCQLGSVKLIFLDEISMVGNAMFNTQINNRLKDLKGCSLPFDGVSIIAIGDLFQLPPVMDGYVFKDYDDFEYGILAPNTWKELFRMFELTEIMRQRESKEFAELLNRLREGKHTKEDILKLKERLIQQNDSNYPTDAPHLFIQNAKVNEFNDKAHHAISSTKYSIKAHDNVIGANSNELKENILKQVPNDPRKTKQLYGILNIAVGERTEISLNTRTDDGLANGSGNVVKLIQVPQTDKPSGIVWVEFDHPYVGEKTRHDNKNLYVQGIQSSWTPIKPVTAQFAVGRNRSVQVIRKQFPLRPAAAKTIHRAQGDTEKKIVVNFETKRTIPHIHYVGLSRVTTIEGLYITNLCEEKIAVSKDVAMEMEDLRTKRKLDLCISPIYKADKVSFKVCFLNARSLHKHIKDVCSDMNYSSTDVSIFSETRFCLSDNNDEYAINGYELFRNDAVAPANTRPYGGIAVYSRLDYYPGYPYSSNVNGIEITVLRFIVLPHITIIAIYRPPRIPVRQLCCALRNMLISLPTTYNIFIGDFNLNWLNEIDRAPLYKLFIDQFQYKQLIRCYTTDNRTCIDHIYTNLPLSNAQANVLETYFSDHKTVYVLVNTF